MVEHILVGMVMIALTVVIHGAFMAGMIEVMQKRGFRPRGLLQRSAVIVGVVLWLFLSICVQCWIWAALFLYLGALGDLETSAYFTTVTFTTLGYGDVVLDREWRLLSAFASANGTIIIGWTTAMVFFAVQKAYDRG